MFEIIPKNTNIDFISKRHLWVVLSIVSMLQPIAYLNQQFQLVHDRHGAAVANDSRDGLTIQALHDKVWVSVLLPTFVNGDDVFVLQACGRP